MDPEQFGNLIKKARLAKQLEVSETARAAQVSVAQWHKIERGTGGMPRVATRRKMMAAVGLDKEPDGDDEPQPARPPEPDQMAELQQAMLQLVRSQADIAKEVRSLRRYLERREAERGAS